MYATLLSGAIAMPPANESMITSLVRSGNAFTWSAVPSTREIDSAPSGTIAQRVYLGTQYRYRIRAGGDDVWVEDPQRRDEGAPVRVLVPPDAMLVFPAAA